MHNKVNSAWLIVPANDKAFTSKIIFLAFKCSQQHSYPNQKKKQGKETYKSRKSDAQ